MTFTQALIMGIVQGLTEFLPISSSGHLAVARELLGAGPAQDVGFEVAVHAGTLLAVLVFYRAQLIELLGGIATGEGYGRKWAVWIIVGTIPAGALGIAFKDNIEQLFNEVHLVGVAWIFTAILLLAGERFSRDGVGADRIGLGRAILVGCAQAAALIPGVSRSGSTIATGLLFGIEKRCAVDFAFILSIPAIGGAMLLTVKDWLDGSVAFALPHLAGGIAAAVSGYWAIVILLKVVAGSKLSWFAAYCLIVGVIALIFG